MLLIDSVMGNSLAKAAALDFGIQWVLWVVAASFKTEKFYDLAGLPKCMFNNSVHVKFNKLVLCNANCVRLTG